MGSAQSGIPKTLVTNRGLAGPLTGGVSDIRFGALNSGIYLLAQSQHRVFIS